MDPATRAFEEHRDHLAGLAYRMLGVHADAQDVVQETYLRWRAAERSEIRDARAWLVTVCSRLALNSLNSARSRRESYVGLWLPEPLMQSPAPGPDAKAQIDESVSIALLLALERLTPAERAAFLLHDVFDYAFPEIAAILEKTPAACRQLASRARTQVRAERPRFSTSATEHQRILEAFLTAAREGRGDDLRAMLAEDAQIHADSGGRAETAPAGLRGRESVSAFLLEVWHRLRIQAVRTEVRTHRLNGEPALLIFENGRLTTTLSATIGRGRIEHLFVHRNPDKLASIARLAAETSDRAAGNSTPPRAD